MNKLTDFEKTGWRYSITATNIRHMWGVADAHPVLDLGVIAVQGVEAG